MEQEKNKNNKKNIGRAVMELIMVIIIILLTVTSIVFGIGGDNGPPPFPPDPGPSPKPGPSPWDWGSNVTFSELTKEKAKEQVEKAKEQIEKKVQEDYLDRLPKKYETIHITYNKVFNLGDDIGNDIDFSVINSLRRDKYDNSITMTTKLSINQSVRNDDIYLVSKTHAFGDSFYGPGVIELWRSPVDEEIGITLTNKIGDQTKWENRVSNVVLLDKVKTVKEYYLVVDNDRPVFDENDIIKNNKLFEKISTANKISVKVNLINEWNPKYELIFE